MLRSALAVVAGLVAGSIANMALITLNTSVLFPMPQGVSPDDPAAFSAYLASLPVAAFVLVLLAHSAQAGVGGAVAARIAAARPQLLALVVGGLTALGSVIMLTTVDGPAWMALDPLLNLACAYGAARWVVGRRPSDSAP